MRARDRRGLRSIFPIACALALLLWGTDSYAQGPGASTASSPGLAAGGLELGNTSSFWARGRARPFMLTVIEAGFLYARPRIALGVGRPHWLWAGVETASWLTASAVGQFVGLRGALPYLDLRVGGRYNDSFDRSVLARRDHYDRFDLDQRGGPGARYWTLEAELSATVPVPGGSVFAVLTGYALQGVAEGTDVFEESLRVIAHGPFVWRTRLGYVFSLGRTGAVRVGPVVECLGVPSRRGYTVRAGLVASVALNAKIEVLASLVPVVAGPDQLGLAGGDFTQLGVRVRWATGLLPGQAWLFGP